MYLNNIKPLNLMFLVDSRGKKMKTPESIKYCFESNREPKPNFNTHTEKEFEEFLKISENLMPPAKV